MSDIVERLRLHGDKFPIKDSAEWIDFASLYLVEAADEIEQLEREQKLIVEERDRTFALMLARAEKAEAALREIAGLGIVCASDMAIIALRDARAALKEKINGKQETND